MFSPQLQVNNYFCFSLVSVVTGNGDGDIFLQKTKFDSTGRSGGGLKRSSSSPNINKVSNLKGGRVILLYESITQRSNKVCIFGKSTRFVLEIREIYG